MNVVSKIIGYCRVSTKGQLENNSLKEQTIKILERYPNAQVFEEAYSGKISDRPIFNEVMELLEKGDTLVVSKLDRFCRSVEEGITSINKLKAKGVNIHILNMGLIEDTPMGDLIVTNLLAFAQFERSMIIERTQSGKAIARARAEAEGRKFREGRPRAHSKENIERALKLLETMSYREVVELTKISKSTLIRAKRERGLI